MTLLLHQVCASSDCVWHSHSNSQTDNTLTLASPWTSASCLSLSAASSPLWLGTALSEAAALVYYRREGPNEWKREGDRERRGKVEIGEIGEEEGRRSQLLYGEVCGVRAPPVAESSTRHSARSDSKFL